MVLFRKLLERLDNKALDLIFSNIRSSDIDRVSESGEFDFHAISVRKIMGITGLKIFKTMIDNEARRLL